MMRRVLLVLAVTLLASFAWCARGPQEREILRGVYTPTFSRMPPPDDLSATIKGLREDLQTAEGHSLLSRLLPDQAGVLWLSLLVTLLVAFNFEQPRDRRNLDLLVSVALGAVLFNIMGFFEVLTLPRYWRLLDVTFTAVFILNLTLLVRACLRAGRSALTAWSPNLPRRALATLGLLLLLCDVLLAMTRAPDDAGYFVNLGAQRLRERGTLPYGDPLLTGTPGAAYGPLLYLAHVPFQLLVSPGAVNPISPSKPAPSDESPYYLPPILATKLCTIALHLAGVLALFEIGRRVSGSIAAGWALVSLYCGSAFVLGVGGMRDQIGGMTFVSHIGPTALTLVAFACLNRPAAAGTLLAVSGGAGFYPLFFLPAWTGFYWRRRAELSRFLVGFAVAAAIIAGGTYALSRPAEGHSRLGTIVRDTLGHHTDPQGYGSSPFGFWGQRGGWRRWASQPLIAGSGLTSPVFLAFIALTCLAFFRARGASAPRLASLTAAIAIGASLIKLHSTGTYVAWAYPFLLIGLLLDGGPRRDSREGSRVPGF
jgi:hypothetical protein